MSKLAYYILLSLILIISVSWAIYAGWLYYSASCQQIRDFPVPTDVPPRCIGVQL